MQVMRADAFRPANLNQSSTTGAGKWSYHQPDALPVSVALASDELPAGELLRACQALRAEEQGQADLALGRKLAHALRWRIIADGRDVSETTEQDGAAAATAAVVAWRNGALPSPVVAPGKTAAAVQVVAWRAVVAEISADTFGNSIELSSVSDQWLLAECSALAVACVAGFETRDEKARRLLAERGKAKRKLRLLARAELVKAAINRQKRLFHKYSRRCALVDKVTRAALLLLSGVSLDAAARLATRTTQGGVMRGGGRWPAAARSRR